MELDSSSKHLVGLLRAVQVLQEVALHGIQLRHHLFGEELQVGHFNHIQALEVILHLVTCAFQW